MRILYAALTENFWMHISEVINNMAGLGHQVQVAGFLRSRPKSLHPSVAFHNISLRNRGWAQLRDRAFWREFGHWGIGQLCAGGRRSFYKGWLQNIMDNTPFDMVYERNCHWNPAVALASARGIPSILEFNGIWPLEAEWKGFAPHEARRFLAGEIASAQAATRAVCVGSGAGDYYIAQGINPNKIHVIPNGANPDLFRPMDKVECRQRMGLHPDERIIGFSGSLQIFYDMDCVLQALPLILRRVPDARTVIVGREYPPPAGPGRGALRALAGKLGVQDRVTLLEPVPYEQVPYYINAFDACLLPLAERENWQAALSPLKLREYLACGRAVVASNVPGDVQLLKPIKAGLLYQPAEPKDLAEQVCTLLQDPARASCMGDNGRRFVLNRGTWQHVAAKIISVAEEIVIPQTT